MSEQYGDQLIVHFLNPLREGYFSSEKPPLRLTLQPWFGLPEERRDELHGELAHIAERVKPIVTKTGEEAWFGRHNNVLVRRVAVEAFRAVHYQLRNIVPRLGGELREPGYSGSDFNPHITQHRPVPEGMKLTVDSFTVIQKGDNPRGNMEVGRTYRLEG